MFNQNLRRIREENNISQTEIANMLKIPVTTYRNYENTNREPGFDLLVRISEVLCVSTDKLLGVSDGKTERVELNRKISLLSNNEIKKVADFVDFLIYKREKNENQ